MSASPSESLAGSGFFRDGFTILPPLLTSEACHALIAAVEAAPLTGAGSRKLLSLDAVASLGRLLANSPSIAALLPAGAQAVQCTLFSKSDGSTWSVTPHQDLSIPVHERRDVAGWSGWSRKEGAWFVQPPVAVLEQMVAVRLQLDDNAADTGPLEVVPGTHVLGRLSSEALRAAAAAGKVPCVVERGGVVVLRPLLIHSSAKGRSPGSRRVLHFLYGPRLPAHSRTH
nr:phytanoyl-CoA dioxygenase family protein [Luteibacter rhizovicinus]